MSATIKDGIARGVWITCCYEFDVKIGITVYIIRFATCAVSATPGTVARPLVAVVPAVGAVVVIQ